MNILFLMKYYEIGGIESVTAMLGSCFLRHGHNVTLATFNEPIPMALARTDKAIKVYTLGKYECSQKNVAALRKILVEHRINVVINQWGLPYIPIKTLCKAKQGLNVKVISVYHNQVDTNARLKAVEQAMLVCNNPLLKCLLICKHKAFKLVTSLSMRYVYKHSDVYEVLSPSFLELFKKFTGIKHPTKLISQTNPITLDDSSCNIALTTLNKQKEIIYVGRLDNVQKRVSRVIDTWSLLEKKFPDWHLTIVGDGEDKQALEEQVKTLGLKRVYFEGFKNPAEYYKRASMLLLTSDFEGFGLVIVEGMRYGVVPFVYGSYPAIYDIVTDNKDGIILPMNENGYDAVAMAGKMSELMSAHLKLEQMANEAIEKSKLFSLETIYKQWNNEFLKLDMGGVKCQPLRITYMLKQKEVICVGRLNNVQKRVG